MNKSIILSLMTAILMAGCASTPSIDTVKVPVIVQNSQSPQRPQRPDLALDRITASTSDSDVLRFYRESIEQIGSYAEQLEILLDAWSVKK